MKITRIATSRRTVQALLVIVFLLLPYLSINGKPALQMDITQRTLYIVGVVVRIDQFFLVLLLTLVLVAAFLLLTMVLGRVWCGWFCPQTVLNDLLDMLREQGRRFRSQFLASVLVHASAAVIAVLVSFSVLCWFVPAPRLLKSLTDFSAHPLLTFNFSFLFIVLYLNLILVKRHFCLKYCPYGRFQAVLLDDATLNLLFLENTRDRCVRCGSCVRACPMGIDIRQGFQIECINCGRCIDACRAVMERSGGGNGLIAYQFGTAPGGGFRLGRKSLILGLLICGLAALLVWGVLIRSEEAFSVQQVATAESRSLPDGIQVQAWRAVIGNHGESAATYSLEVAAPPDMQVGLLGPVEAIRVAPNENRPVSFSIRFKPVGNIQIPVELRLLKDGTLAASVRIRP